MDGMDGPFFAGNRMVASKTPCICIGKGIEMEQSLAGALNRN